MKSSRRRFINDDSKSLGSQMPGLSLFIILLAFFIMLNSISVIKEEKVKPLMDSVEEAFAARIVNNENWLPATSPSEEKGSEEGRTLQRIEALFQSHIAGIETQKDEMTGALLMRMPYDDFAKAVSSVGDKATQNEAFMKTLTSMMRSSHAGQPYRMDIFLQVDDNPATMHRKQPQKMTVLMRDLSTLAQSLEKAGLSQRLMSIGMEKGQSGHVELLFRPHIPHNRISQAED